MTRKIPVRFYIWLMVLTSCMVSYMLRVNMSLNLIAMVGAKKQKKAQSPCITGKAGNDTTSVAKKHGSFDWSDQAQGMVLGSYFWSYPISSFVGGPLAEYYGPRLVVLHTVFWSALLTFIIPLMATYAGYVSIVIIRILLGLAGGFVYPALHCLVAKWTPPIEKGKFLTALMGGTLGTVLTWSISGFLIDAFGWESSFYVPAVISFLYCGIWWYNTHNSPREHPRIDDDEKTYILDLLAGKVAAKQPPPPWKYICTSIPFLAMIILHYGNLWGLYFVMTVGPRFISAVLGFELKSAGVIAALPYLARVLGATIFGSIGDYVLANNHMPTTLIRKFFCLFSHIIPGILLLCIVPAGCMTAVSVALITMSMGFNGGAGLTNLQNHQDLAPNYAGTLYGIANAIGGTAGWVTPMVSAHYTESGNSFDNWRPIFYFGSGAYILAAILFIILGTGETQWWNYPEKVKARMNENNKFDEPEEKKPEGTKPGGIKPEGIKPGGIKPEGIKPEGIKPEVNNVNIRKG